MGEDLPQEDNRVTLDSQKVDVFGVPLPRIAYRSSENDIALRSHAHKKAREILEAAGAKKVYTDKEQLMAIHFMGTTRMGKDPKTSVVDSFGRTHDVKNLFLAGSSIFVTASPAPPTLTIQALAARTADHILSEGKKGNLS
jgi:choline dehydrogenase-like flavoprotein